MSAITDTKRKRKAAYTEYYSLEMKALCDLAISILKNVHDQGMAPRYGDVMVPTEDIMFEAVHCLDGGIRVPGATWGDLAKLFGNLYKHTLQSEANLDGQAAMLQEPFYSMIRNAEAPPDLDFTLIATKDGIPWDGN